MPRRPRLDPHGGYHHVWNRGVAKRNVFFADTDRVEFGQQLAEMNSHFGIEVNAYCLMDNHYHLLVHCPEGGLSPAMQRLGSSFTRHVNDRTEQDGPIFRGRFSSRLVTTHDYLAELARYVHRNALDISGVDAVENYRWSSHRCYLGLRVTPAWLNTEPILRYFQHDRDAFHQFVCGEAGL
jgi:REP element-mobilizing transposase RayT